MSFCEFSRNNSRMLRNYDGTKMYVGNSGIDVNEYSLSSTLFTASYTRRFPVNAQETPQGMTFNNDGTKMFVIGYTGDNVNEYSLSTAFNISTASYVRIFR